VTVADPEAERGGCGQSRRRGDARRHRHSPPASRICRPDGAGKTAVLAGLRATEALDSDAGRRRGVCAAVASMHKRDGDAAFWGGGRAIVIRGYAGERRSSTAAIGAICLDGAGRRRVSRHGHGAIRTWYSRGKSALSVSEFERLAEACWDIPVSTRTASRSTCAWPGRTT
jgi:hypothetical protein